VLGRHTDDDRVLHHHGERGEVALRIERGLHQQMVIDGERAGMAEQQGAAVRLRLDHAQCGDIAAKPRMILEFDRRTETCRQRRPQWLHRCGAGASRRKRDHDLDRFGNLRGSRPRQSRRTDHSQRGTARHRPGERRK
jgi:hypothetical protein